MRTLHLILGLCVSLSPLSVPVYAIAPSYQTDADLTQYPILVVAKWDKAPMRPHHLSVGNVCKKFEVFTELILERVIKGDIAPGKHTILMGLGIGWQEDGAGLATWTSTHIPGDVDDVTKPSLWFLDRKRSWDPSDKILYYHVPHYRAIQPVTLEEYFGALRSPRPETDVPKLLVSDNPEVLIRVLRYVCGGVWPWPVDASPRDERSPIRAMWGPLTRGRMLTEQAEAVRRVVERGVGGVSPLAVSVYAELTGKDGVPYLRSLLKDRDPTVRGVAIGLLARHRDQASVAAMAEAARGVRDGHTACALIEALSGWADPRLAPVLIPFLQNDAFAYQYGDDLGIPALKAREALHKIAGCWFPHNVAVAAAAWKRAEATADPAKRKALLDKLLPGGQFPVTAHLVGSPEYVSREAEAECESHASFKPIPRSEENDAKASRFSARVRLTSVSGQPVTLAKMPSWFEMRSPSRWAQRGGLFPEHPSKDDFLHLAPGESTEFRVTLDADFLLAKPQSRRLRLFYKENGNAVNVSAWIGWLDVQLGPEWKEEREVEKVRQRWPNGNLKAVGQKVNGRRRGEWHFFNEEGSRTRVVDYTRGSEAKCNPEHPDNKGAGLRPDSHP